MNIIVTAEKQKFKIPNEFLKLAKFKLKLHENIIGKIFPRKIVKVNVQTIKHKKNSLIIAKIFIFLLSILGIFNSAIPKIIKITI